jgi:hypothetical protein
VNVVSRVLVVIALGAAALALIASNAVAGRSSAASALIPCPLVSGVIPPCCGPPISQPRAVSPCCPAPGVACCSPVAGAPSCCAATPCTDSLSIAATPDPATDGDKATISGTLAGGTVAARQVSLWQRLAGATAFTQVEQTQTDSSGGFRFVQTVHTNAEWYAQTGSAVSATMHEPVRAAVALLASSVRPAAGAKLRLSGRVAPSHAGEGVALEQLRGSRWVTVARPKLGTHSTFTVIRKAARSVERFRIVLAADARNSLSVSAAVAVTARG